MSFGLLNFLDDELVNINTFQKYLDLFKKVYVEKIGYEGVQNAISNAISIFSKCQDNNKKLINKTGIVIGKVQSGKTSNFLGLTALGFDNDIDIVVLIGGKDTKLLNQNDKRIREIFQNNNDKVIIENINKAIRNPDNYAKHLQLDKNNKVIITCLKNASNLKKLNTFFEYSNLNSKNIIIIDDEADQATLNGNAETNKSTVTSLYEKVTDFKKKLSSYAYIQVTATPYANLFLRDIDILKPTFVEITYPGESYMGLPEFHGDNSNQYIRIIEDYDNLNQESEGNPIETSSFSSALSFFLIASSLKMIDDQKEDSKSNMLIHTDRLVIEHSNVVNSLEKKVGYLKSISKLSKENLVFLDFLGYLNLGFKEYFNRDLDYFKNKLDNEIVERVKFILNYLDIVEVNRNNMFRNEERLSILPHAILIGADLVERGITIPNLLITYITRRSKGTTNADTVLQRARWFGYRNNIKQYIRIFCSKEIQDDYEKILIMDDDLWFSLDDMRQNEEILSEWIKVLNLSKKNLRPTRKGVAAFELEEINTWHAQKELKENQELEYNLYNKLLGETTAESYHNVMHKIKEYESIYDFEKEFANIINNILDYCNVTFNFWDYWKKSNSHYKVKVLIMNPESDDNYRTLINKEQIQVFRGRSKKEKVGNYYYKGDRNLYEDPRNKNTILLELFKFNIYKKSEVKYKKGDLLRENALFYAFYFPGEGVIRYVSKHN